MNKTVTINISGIIFHIEENAYDKLSRYLNTIKGYFSASEGRDEIMADIEARIAEILKDKTGPTKQVVLMTDVDAVMALMGKPEEFASDSSSSSSTNYEPNFTMGSSTSTKRRRVFRDPDDKVLGGVCSGISAYFNIDPLWLRLILAIAFFAYGFGLLLYILLWIIIPEAKTTAEKLEMRGENVTVDNISKTVKEEMDQLKSRMEKWGNEAKQTSFNQTSRARDFFDRLADFLKSIFGPVFKFLAKAIAVVAIIISAIIIIGLFGSILGLNDVMHINNNGDHFSFSLYELMNALGNNSFDTTLLIIGVVLFVSTPLLMLIYWGIKMMFNIKTSKRAVGITANILWISGLILCIYSGIELGKNFSKKHVSKQTIPIANPTSEVLYLKLKKNSILAENENYDSRVKIDDWNYIKNNGKIITFGTPLLNIEKSETDSFELLIWKSARGANNKDAFLGSKLISYKVEQSDSLLEFNSYFDIENEKFRKQDVKLNLKVPVGKVIYLDKSIDNLIYDIHNVTNTWDGDMIGRRWKMTEEGLQCVDCEGIDMNDHKISIKTADVSETLKEAEKTLLNAQIALDKAADVMDEVFFEQAEDDLKEAERSLEKARKELNKEMKKGRAEIRISSENKDTTN